MRSPSGVAFLLLHEKPADGYLGNPSVDGVLYDEVAARSVFLSAHGPAYSQTPPQAISPQYKRFTGSVVRHLAQYRFHPDQDRCLPGQPARPARSGKVTVWFATNRSGVVLDARIVKSSGITDLDRAALLTIRSASPIPVPPDDLRSGEPRLQFILPLDYRSPCREQFDRRSRPRPPT